MSAATTGGFDDPTAQRLEPITTGADPQVVGPLLADALHDRRWLACDVALIAGGKSNLTYRIACDAGEATRTVSVAKAYVSRAAREVAHGALQVFGGIAVTEEHPAHRYLRRIVVRERQFGDAAHHERALGRELASLAVREAVS